ncbi:hypothetical protein LSTR_LSTR002579 [Laodelphax striatellus]|uniref:N-acetyltransferase domain-containing protein n=1 Tax=Laodelphax striatellus TaxID=195883 RepID=A0A482XLB4_LAOST|nr:hypothetical protein LSTR_LSTR002579 [Laodelphax striatellus]
MATQNMFDDEGSKPLFDPPRETLLDISVPLKVRIKLPTIREKLQEIGVRVTDLRKERYEEALDHVKRVFYPEEPLCQSLNIIEDEESYNSLHEHIRLYLKDTQSLIALKEDTNEIVGVLVSRVFDSLAMKTFERMAIYKGEKFKAMQRLRNHFLRYVELKKSYGTDVWNCIYLCTVDPDFRRLGIGDALFEAAIQQTKRFRVDVIGGVFTSYPLQMLAKKKGFENLLEVQYSEWTENKEIVFKNTGQDNTAIFMGKCLVDKSKESLEDIINEDNVQTNISSPGHSL